MITLKGIFEVFSHSSQYGRLAFLIGSFFAKTADMKGLCGEYAVWSMLLCAAIGYIAFS